MKKIIAFVSIIFLPMPLLSFTSACVKIPPKFDLAAIDEKDLGVVYGSNEVPTLTEIVNDVNFTNLNYDLKESSV
ncbi:hypothetical protein [Spiroplasma tabanidicola]|nr:hypothetical protein [Spiroplasma tabanidicola]